jgi:two-component system, NtrC family, sensor kinase
MTRDADDQRSRAGRVSDLREIGPAASGPRDAPLDAVWLERLLRLALELPTDEGAAKVAQIALDRLSELFPNLAFGICVVDGSERIIETRVPEFLRRDAGHDPSRLFPELAAERVLPLGERLSGSTLHVASDDALALGAGALESRITDYATAVIEHALYAALALDHALGGGEELRRLQGQMIQAEKLASLGQIVAGVVHELNNPLTSIIVYSDFLQRRLSGLTGVDPDDAMRARRIGEAAERILRFSRDLVAYARPTGDVPGPVVLHEVIEKALVFCEHEFEKHGVELERRWHDSLPLVRGISGQLTQVFVNLFTNAAHAMSGNGGRLVVATLPGEEPDWVLVEVVDDGIGIAPEHLERIFEPFFTTKTEGRGTGLGLSIVRDIVAAHGGALEADSIPGGGATFRLRLPTAARPPTSRPPEG